MGRAFYLQDDAFFKEMAWFRIPTRQGFRMGSSIHQ